MRRIGWAGPALLLAVGGFLALGPSSEGLRWRPEHLAPLLRGGPGPVALLLLGLLAPFPLAAWARGRFDGRADRVGACLGVALAAQALAFAAAVRFGTAGYLAACLATAAAGVGLGFERGRWRSAFADYGLAVGPLVLFGLLSAGLGQDTDFDFHNYHYYNGHSLAEGRLGADLAVGNLEGAFNPLMDTAAYLLSRLVPPPWFGFTLGALHGAAFVLLALLAREALAGAGVVENRARLAVACAAAGVVEPMFLTQLGTWFHEDLLAVLALAATWLVARRLGDSAKLWRGALAAGLLVGAATGLKLTAAAVALGLGAAIGAAAPGIANRARSLAAWGAGALAGFLLADGFWMARLWDRYRNPVFPFFNGLFRSPYWPAESFDFLRPMPWHEHLALPFHLALSGDPVGQFGTRDPRLALVATLAIAGVLLAAWHAWRRWRGPGTGSLVGWVATQPLPNGEVGEAGSRPGLQETLQSTAGGSLPPRPPSPSSSSS